MNSILWVLQILLALHTAVGAGWKFSHSEQTVPALKAIPHELWLAMAVVELLCSLGLVLAAVLRPAALLVPIAATCIAAEMLLFCALQLRSADAHYSHVAYWLVVAGICAFIIYGRWVVTPL